MYDEFAALEIIKSRRKGGAVNIAGLSYQLKYSCYKALQFLTKAGQIENRFLQLEGIEDLDKYRATSSSENKYEFIQLKHSENKINAYSFWEKGILQNFAEVYLKNKDVKFKLVYDMSFTKGNLDSLVKENPSRQELQYWENKFDNLKGVEKAKDWNWSKFEFLDFINKIEFEKIQESRLNKKCRNLLIENYDINSGNEMQFLKALFYNIFHWAKNREEITYLDVREVIQNVKEDIAKGEENPAVEWIRKVDFNKNEKKKNTKIILKEKQLDQFMLLKNCQLEGQNGKKKLKKL